MTAAAIGIVRCAIVLGPDAAQLEIEAHVRSTAAGRCAGCNQEVPCASRVLANSVLLRHGLLPRRVPGAALLRAKPFNAWGD